ncbi:SMI1/KNR4 family protein [Pseudomonas sp. CVAP|uniref:SMI1/KNR4 family protein n=1 Tax=Pseudomonas sp. CVAP\|nr:SMI1/KNR4 family protein [Pseudomonas sp. CVAP\
MQSYQDLTNKLDTSSEETFWFGACSKDQIAKLEKILELKLPQDFIDFLETCGGGGVVESEICGIENNDASLESGATVNYSTTYCQANYELPNNLAVIYLKNDEVCWAIDCSTTGNGKVLSYDLLKNKISKVIAVNFYSFFEEYVELRS